MPRASVAVMTTRPRAGADERPDGADHVPGSPAASGELSPCPGPLQVITTEATEDSSITEAETVPVRSFAVAGQVAGVGQPGRVQRHVDDRRPSTRQRTAMGMALPAPSTETVAS